MISAVSEIREAIDSIRQQGTGSGCEAGTPPRCTWQGEKSIRTLFMLNLCIALASTAHTMSSLPKLSARARIRVSTASISPVRFDVLRRRPIMFSTSPSTFRPLPLHHRPLALSTSRHALKTARRYASTATATKELEEEEEQEEEEEVWPERILPVLNGSDRKRLKRQRNVGMCVKQGVEMSSLIIK